MRVSADGGAAVRSIRGRQSGTEQQNESKRFHVFFLINNLTYSRIVLTLLTFVFASSGFFFQQPVADWTYRIMLKRVCNFMIIIIFCFKDTNQKGLEKKKIIIMIIWYRCYIRLFIVFKLDHQCVPQNDMHVVFSPSHWVLWKIMRATWTEMNPKTDWPPLKSSLFACRSHGTWYASLPLH